MTIKSVYGFTTSLTAGGGKTIGIVDAYDDPTAESDLGVFSSQYGLPTCTTANGCFQKVNQTGGTKYPRANSGWALEISLDVQWAHAIAPGAKILLVEASSNSFTNLLAAEDYAKTHAKYVSNSWGGSESSGETAYDSHFVESGVSFFVSAGDSGLPAQYPSSSPNVISVGGTTLNFSGGNFVSETGWSSGGGGCSADETAMRCKPPLANTDRSTALESAPRPTCRWMRTPIRAYRSTTAHDTTVKQGGLPSVAPAPVHRCGRLARPTPALW
ncbi:MAG: S8 family serine peptidase [Aggregatilineales bacterium]